jgi:hypothetical protein
MMAEVLKLAEQYAIVAEAERPPTPVRVLKHGDGFAVFDPRGDIVPAQSSEQGFYYAGTRFLSQFELLLANRQPLLLSSTSAKTIRCSPRIDKPDVLKATASWSRGYCTCFVRASCGTAHGWNASA